MAAKLEVEVSVLDKLSAHVAQMNGTLSNFARNVEGTFSTFTKGFVAVGALAGVAAGIRGVMSESFRLAESVTKISHSYGMSTKAVQEWDYVLKQNESSLDQCSSAFKVLTKTTFEAFAGNKTAQNSFELLGVSIKDHNGNLKTTEQISKDVILAIAGLENPTVKAGLAQRFFGKETQSILPLLSNSKREILDSLDAANRYGQVLNDDVVKKLDDAGDAMERVNTSFKVMGASITGIVAGPLKLWADGVTIILEKFNKWREHEREIDEASKRFLNKEKGISNLPASATATAAENNPALAAANAELLRLQSILDKQKNRGKDEKEAERRKARAIQAAVDIAESEKIVEDERRKEGEENTRKLLENIKKRTEAEKQFLEQSKRSKQEIKEIDENNLRIKEAEKRAQQQVATNAVQNLEMIASKHKEFTGLYKTAAIAQATMDMRASAIASYKSMASIPIVGPALGFVAAAAAIAFGLDNIKQIATQRMASGGSGAPGWYSFGEHGPEKAYMPSPFYTYNAVQTKNISSSESTVINAHFYDKKGNEVETIRASLRSGRADGLVRDLKMAIAR